MNSAARQFSLFLFPTQEAPSRAGRESPPAATTQQRGESSCAAPDQPCGTRLTTNTPRPTLRSAATEDGLQIGYVLKMFPRLSETFIRNEILELERQGLGLRI